MLEWIRWAWWLAFATNALGSFVWFVFFMLFPYEKGYAIGYGPVFIASTNVFLTWYSWRKIQEEFNEQD